ncbi:hypothetical protein Tco_0415476 [Tanacetum coccineum]
MSDSDMESGVTFNGRCQRTHTWRRSSGSPPSPELRAGPEEPEQAPPSPDYVTGLEHADDEIVAEDQPYAEDTSPTAQSPDYVLSLILRRTRRRMMMRTPRRILSIILPMEEMTGG